MAEAKIVNTPQDAARWRATNRAEIERTRERVRRTVGRSAQRAKWLAEHSTGSRPERKPVEKKRPTRRFWTPPANGRIGADPSAPLKGLKPEMRMAARAQARLASAPPPTRGQQVPGKKDPKKGKK